MTDELVFADEVIQSGFTQVWNFLLEDASLSQGSRLLYILLCRFAWNQTCHPGQQKLSEILGVEPRRVRDYLAELKTRSLVTVKRRGRGKTNLYVIHAPVKKRSRPVIDDRSSGVDERSSTTGLERSSTTALTRARLEGLENTSLENSAENSAPELRDDLDQNPETRSHEEQAHNLDGVTEDSLLTSDSSMTGIGESKPLEQLPQTATDQPFDPNTNENPRKADLPENHRPARPDPKGGGHVSDQVRRREEQKAGKTPWEIQAASASTAAAVPLTKRQAKKARTKGEAEKWLARHTSTSNS